ncbi:MAG: glycogen/starch synthase [Saprospiraceae bacterium]|nr:glycogen/starch synthase [Saprospiraceae bacterium]
MADKKRILIVTQELKPYTILSQVSDIVRQYAQFVQEKGMEVRILMPKFGPINERRHRLHEVVRLSGMNINVDEDDYPLIIKVASLPGTRMQVYFLDNEEYFKRKQIFENVDGKFFEDNLDRTLFFCKGVVETVKKFGWSPDIVHCHGWMTSLLPALLRTFYINEPIFRDARVVYSAYDAQVANSAFDGDLRTKALDNGFGDVVDSFYTSNGLDLNAGASKLSDGTIAGVEDVALENLSGLILDYQEDLSAKYLEFYEELLEATEEKV